jgi:hypothetical protein
MIKEIVEQWEKNKSKLEEYFSTHPQEEYSDYEDIMKLVINLCINEGIEERCKRYNVDKMAVIYGDYPGVQIFVIPRNAWIDEVDDFIYTHNQYGTCSSCDTLKAIWEGNPKGLPTKEQVKDYMTLALHLVQRFHKFKDCEED